MIEEEDCSVDWIPSQTPSLTGDSPLGAIPFQFVDPGFVSPCVEASEYARIELEMWVDSGGGLSPSWVIYPDSIVVGFVNPLYNPVVCDTPIDPGDLTPTTTTTTTTTLPTIVTITIPTQLP